MFYYAQLDANNKVVGLSQLSGEVTFPYMIPITESQVSDTTLFGKTYSNGQFI